MIFMSLMVPSKHEPTNDGATSEATASATSSSMAPEAPAAPPAAEAAAPRASGPDPAATLGALHLSLRQAADAAHLLGMPLDELMQLSWSAFVDARPGLREHLADAQLAQQIQELRAQGRVGQA